MNWDQRKAVGDALERRVAEELEARGWVVDYWGQGVLRPEIRQTLSRSDTRLRELPDLIATRDGDIVTVDCKDRMSSADTGRYAVSRTCLTAGLQFLGAFNVPLFYVFGNLRVLTPPEVISYGTLGPRARGGSYLLVPGRLGHHFDDVFGPIRKRRDEAA